MLGNDLLNIVEKGMEQHFLCCDSLLRIELKHLVQQIQEVSASRWHNTSYASFGQLTKIIILSFELVASFAPVL